MTALKHWLFQVLIALDQALNAVCGGWADETMSCHLYRLHRDGKPWGVLMVPVDRLFALWQPITERDIDGRLAIGHCHQAYLKERRRYNFPPEMRDALASALDNRKA